MAMKLTVALHRDATPGRGLSHFAPGALLQGSVNLSADEEVYLNSITVFLRWIVESNRPRDVVLSADQDAEIEDAVLVFRGQIHKVGQDEVSAIAYLADPAAKIADQRKISKESYAGFLNLLPPHTAHAWDFTLQVPREPWSYQGQLFTIQWEVEAKADIGRSRLRFLREEVRASTSLVVTQSPGA